MSTSSSKHPCALFKIFQKDAPPAQAKQPARTNAQASRNAPDAAAPAQENRELQDIQNGPAAFFSRQPSKQAEQEGGTGSAAPAFPREALADKEYVTARDALRQQATSLNKIAATGRAVFAANDQADGFADSFRHAGLQSMEQNGLMAARLAESPWSDDYWAIYLGILGKRYADPNFPNSADWKKNYDYVQNSSAAAAVEMGNAAAIDWLSPSEKYDILVGDKSYSLTRKMWDEGRSYYVNYGTVEPWMGLCHGWSPAAYMLPRPKAAAKVMAADGKTRLAFYPSDIKALATLLWAKCAPQVRFIGGRCNDKNPAVDPQTGRLLAQQCFDTNPGTWHLAIVNQIGASKRSLIMDATYDYEVWNQPIAGYSYRYFNPQQMVYAGSLASATVARAAFSNDWFGQYRSSGADSIVGIAMDVSYVAETLPSHSPADSAAADRIVQVRYYYDLELDFAGKIIGGEWYTNQHPDFLWTPPPGSKALPSWESRYALSGTWQKDQPMPMQWQQIAAITSQGQKAPLAAIVEQLIQLANA